MPYKQYTRCYNHTVGDKPFNQADLASFVLGNSVPGIVIAALGLIAGGVGVPIAIWAIIIQYAVTIRQVASEWLYHRLVCLTGDQCAVGTLVSIPRVEDGGNGAIPAPLGEFDNDQTFDLRLMPHRFNDVYNAPNCNYATFGAAPALIQGPPSPGPAVYGWAMQAAPSAGPSLDGLTEMMQPANDMFLDRFQGSALLQPGSPVEAPRAGPVLFDLPYDPIPIDELQPPLGSEETAAPSVLTGSSVNCTAGGPQPSGGKAAVTRSTIHCEAEGNFWQEMFDTAGLQGMLTGAGAAGGAAAGAAIGCEIGSGFLGIGCALGALLGFLFGLAGGAAGGAYVGAALAFNSQEGDVNDANVGDVPLGTLSVGDQVVVFGTHVYDGFHEGWHEIHPLKAIQRCQPAAMAVASTIPPYIEWDPNWAPGGGFPVMTLPAGLTVSDMQQGLASPAFRAMAESVQQQWCRMLRDAFSSPVVGAQKTMEHRWTIHPRVDGCHPAGGGAALAP